MNSYQAKSSSELPENIKKVLKIANQKSKKIVLVTGVFDILHHEHKNFLKQAKKIADILIIAIESDFRVGQIKGKTRPINKQNKRVNNLLNLKITKNIFILPNEFNMPEHHLNLIKTIRPNFLAVSSHTLHLDKKRKIMNMVDGKLVVVCEQNPNISSTRIIEKEI